MAKRSTRQPNLAQPKRRGRPRKSQSQSSEYATREIRATGAATAGKSDLSRRIETAMADAVKQAEEDGIGVDDSDEIRRYMSEARERAIADFNAEQSAARDNAE